MRENSFTCPPIPGMRSVEIGFSEIQEAGDARGDMNDDINSTANLVALFLCESIHLMHFALSCLN